MSYLKQTDFNESPRIPMLWLQSHLTRLRSITSKSRQNLGNSNVLLAIMWSDVMLNHQKFGCRARNISSQNPGIPIVWLQSYMWFNVVLEANGLQRIARNSYALAAVTSLGSEQSQANLARTLGIPVVCLHSCGRM